MAVTEHVVFAIFIRSTYYEEEGRVKRSKLALAGGLLQEEVVSDGWPLERYMNKRKGEIFHPPFVVI